MKALLLAAGLGTRLRPLTNSVPKCLVVIQGRPLLDYWLELLVAGGVHPILINLHYLTEQVQEYLARSYYKKYVQTVYEEKLLGTGGTLRANRDFFQDEAFMLIYADNLSKFDVQKFREHHQNRPKHCQITMMTFTTPRPQSCGIVELDAQGLVQAFHEKVAEPPGNLANAAVYIFEPSVLTEMFQIESVANTVDGFFDLSRDIIPRFLGKIYTYHNSVYHRDIGSPESLALAQQEYMSVI